MRTCTTLMAAVVLFASFPGVPPAKAAERESVEVIRLGHVLGLRRAEMTKEYRIALELMMKRVFAGFGFNMVTNAYQTPAEALDAFWNGDLDVTEISSLDYVLLPEEKQKMMDIVGVVNLSESRFKQYTFLAAPGVELKDLEGEPIRVVGNGDWNVGRRWLDLEMMERFGKTAEEFFGEVTVVDHEEPNEALLPTFFGKSKGCLVMSYQVSLLAELNPQINVRLKPLMESPEFLGLLFVIRSNFDRTKIEKLKATTASIHKTPDGQQALTLMKIRRMSRGSEEDLEPVREFAKRLTETPKYEFIAALPDGIQSEEEK